jgi:hypothetical protein
MALLVTIVVFDIYFLPMLHNDMLMIMYDLPINLYVMKWLSITYFNMKL